MARCISTGEDGYGPNYAMVLDCVEGQISASEEMRVLLNQIGDGKKYPLGSPTHQITRQCSDKWADGLGLNYVQFKRCVNNGMKYGITP